MLGEALAGNDNLSREQLIAANTSVMFHQFRHSDGSVALHKFGKEHTSFRKSHVRVLLCNILHELPLNDVCVIHIIET